MRVLFVCLGNICRSPAAEGVVRAKAPEWEIDSAGTSDWHVGKPPYGPMQSAALARGIDLSGLRARQFKRKDFNDFDLIVVMDQGNLSDVEALRPVNSETPIRLMTAFDPNAADHVPDPYYTRDFNGCLELIERCAAGLVRQYT